MELNVHKEVAALQRLGAKQLRGRYAEVFGETTTANNKTWLIRRIAWRLQALAEGDLTERARKQAEELGNDADLRMKPPRPKVADASRIAAAPAAVLPFRDARLPPAGSVLVRKYRCGYRKCQSGRLAATYATFVSVHCQRRKFGAPSKPYH